MLSRRFQLSLWALIIFATLAAGMVLTSRVRVEEANRTVTLAVDFQEVQKLARWSGLSTDATLQRLQQQGVNAVLFKEQTLEDLQQLVRVQPGVEAILTLPAGLRGKVHPDYNYLFTDDRQLAQRLELQLANKVPGGVQVLAGDGFTALGVPLAVEELKGLGLGFPEREMALVRDRDILIVPQIRWWYGANAASLAAVFRPLESFQGSLGALLFNDRILPGYPAFFTNLAGRVEQLQAPVGLIEFFPQQDLKQLVMLLDKKAIRVHSISAAEMAGLDTAAALERLDLAARERNNRLLVARFIFAPGSSSYLQDNLSYLSEIRQTLLSHGLTIGRAVPFASFPFSRLWLSLTGLGVLAAGVLLMMHLRLPRLGLALGCLGLVLWAGALGFNYQLLLARKVMALGAAIIFPTLALLTAWSQEPRNLKSGLAVALRTALVSLLGALAIAALLADNTFFLKINEFSGVKIAFVVPLLLFTVAVIIRQEGRRTGATLRRWLDTGLTVKLLLLAVVVAAAGVIYISRSGNEGVGLLPFEGQLRSFLGDVLLVRPRTKEFLIGYPFLLLSLSLGYQHRYLLFWLLGLVGQISLVNTFCHIHIPLLISLLRTFNGLWLGLLIGLILVLAVKLGAGVSQPAAAVGAGSHKPERRK